MDVIGIDISDDELENKIQKRPQGQGSSDSDSTDELIPVVKKKRRTHRAKPASKAPALIETTSSGIYNTLDLSNKLTALREGKISYSCTVLPVTELDDTTVADKRPTPEKNVFETKKTSPLKRSMRNRKPVSSCNEPVSVTVDSDSDEEMWLSREKYPTPPPFPSPPKQIPVKTRRRRQPRALKNALSNLDQARKIQRIEDNEECVIDMTSPQPMAKEITIKVRSRSGIQRFTMKKTDSFTGIVEKMAGHEAVPKDRIVMFHNDTRIQDYDSPVSLKMHIADILECHILRPGEKRHEPSLDQDNNPDSINLKLLGWDAKHSTSFCVKKDEALLSTMLRYAAKFNVDYGQLQFSFDGDNIEPSDTPEELDLEDGFCIDVRL